MLPKSLSIQFDLYLFIYENNKLEVKKAVIYLKVLIKNN